ncbi:MULTISPECIES: hypothetical protein [unclassified Aeromicrobium]|uniref:hypothetical protein n=1 Tax=unclassified Aeromicrobium TaxID=2633570 RepID=UPI00288A8219|nr:MULTISPECIES: hypothetical protein [unclassified Aeromicrobium]
MTTQPITPEAPATEPEPVTPRHIAPSAPEVPDPAPQAPEDVVPARTIADVIAACDEFTALEWLAVVRELDMPSHSIQGDVALAALAVAVVEDARASAFWRWDKYGSLSATKLLTALGVDLEAAQTAVQRPHPHAAPKSDDE